MKRIFFGALILVSGGAFLVAWGAGHTICLSGRYFIIEKAQTSEERAQGLAGRETLCTRCAMLFIFPSAGDYPFWMRGMRFPLDIIWVGEDGRVVHVVHDIPATSQDIVRSPAQARYVIEVAAGQARTVGPGDMVRLPFSLPKGQPPVQ